MKTGVALASAAAVVAATPALAPSISLPTPPALSQAKYELTDFATFLQFLTDPAELEYAYFTGWGGAIAPIDPDPQEPVYDYWLPDCNYDCSVNGLSGVAYMLLDALINGDQVSDAWPVSAVNYFFEGSFSTGIQYILESPFLGEPYQEPGPLYNPAIADAIALAFQGPYLLTTLWYAALGTVAAGVAAVPVIGTGISEGIYAYLYGYSNELTGVTAPSGLSGVLAYVVDTLTQTFGGLLPSAAATPAASLVASAAAAVPTSRTSVVAPKADVAEVAAVSTPAVESVVADNTPKEEVASNDEVTTPEAEDAVTETVDATGTELATEETEPVAEVEAPAEEADDSAVSAPAETKPAKAPKRPVRNAVERVTKSIQSALGGEKADAPTSGAADSAS